MDANQRATPILSNLASYVEQGHSPFHVPGHKKGRGMDPEFRALAGVGLLAMDVTNIDPLDDLHRPKAMIKEAHGSHFYFHPDLPLDGMGAHADLAAVSVHKLGGSLTQSSLLNLRGTRVSSARIQTMLNTLTTTSASFLLLASLDAARRHLVLEGRKILTRVLELAEQARGQINAIPGLWCPGKEAVQPADSIFDLDRSKLVISVQELGISGRLAERWLSRNWAVEAELGDLHNVLCIITAGDDQQTIARLLAVLRGLSEEFWQGHKVKPARVAPMFPLNPHLVLTPRKAFYAVKKRLKLKEAIGEIASEWIMTYPPGIPLILPGEVLDRPTYERIRECQRAGLAMLGPEDSSLREIWVVEHINIIRGGLFSWCGGCPN